MGIKKINAIEEVCEEICHAEVDIAKFKEEITGLMSVQRMIKLGERKKL